jgi:hypothetical protein
VSHSHHTLGPSPVGAVVLDIGADVGALVIHVPAACQGQEIDISSTDGKHTHSAVRERELEHGSIYCLVYPSLTEGEYTIWTDETTAARTATIVGGEITELDWTDRQPDPPRPPANARLSGLPRDILGPAAEHSV